MSKTTKMLLEKSRDSAVQAISTYNDPRSSFRTGNFTILMMVAWTVLIHSHFERRKIKYFYKQPNGRYETIDGERRAWDLSESIKHVFDKNDPIRSNIELFIKLRNKIEHRNLPQLDPELMGESQALVLNFESWLIGEYSNEYSLIDTLFIPIQLTATRRAFPKTKIEDNILKFIKDYRNVLSPNIVQSQQFSFKAYLVPKIGNHRSSSDIAIEFIKYDENNPDEMKKYDKAIVAIKEKQVPVVNNDLYKPSDVLAELLSCGFEKNMTWHTLMWRKYKVRPPSDSANKTHCKTEYCVFDAAHGDYLYTQQWINLLLSNLNK